MGALITLTGISLLLVFMLVFFFKNNYTMQILMLFVMVAVNNTGYMFLCRSSTVEEAVLANKISYLGSIFISYLLMVIISDMCNIRFPRWLRPVLIAYSFFIVYLISTSA